MNRYLVLLAATALLVATSACASHAKPAPPPPTVNANGRSIFQTGKNSSGVQIVARPAALMSSCAACHRADGAGGLHFARGAVSADLRYKALVTGQAPRPYTITLLERAIATGIDNNGQPLNPVMPRWRLSPADLHDVAAYVLTALK
jgi:mono/diheme cytochrome c family protein